MSSNIDMTLCLEHISGMTQHISGLTLISSGMTYIACELLVLCVRKLMQDSGMTQHSGDSRSNIADIHVYVAR